MFSEPARFADGPCVGCERGKNKWKDGWRWPFTERAKTVVYEQFWDATFEMPVM